MVLYLSTVELSKKMNRMGSDLVWWWRKASKRQKDFENALDLVVEKKTSAKKSQHISSWVVTWNVPPVLFGMKWWAR